MYIDSQTLITAGAVLAALTAFVTLGWKLFKWIDSVKELKQNMEKLEAKHERDIADVKEKHRKDIEAVRTMHNHDRDGIQKEQRIVISGLLACLKGLAEQGCDGPVSDEIEHIENYLNDKSHGRD